MEKPIINSYGIMVILLLLLVGYAALKSRIEVIQNFENKGFEQITGYTVERKVDSNSVTGWSNIYRFTVGQISGDYDCLMIYSVHQTIKVLVDNRCVYELSESKGKMHWKSPGYLWNDILLFPEDEHKEISVVLVPVYASADEIAPLIYMGTRYSIVRHIVNSELFSIFMGGAVVFLGLFIMAIVWTLRRSLNHKTENFMVGLFTLLVGIWKLTATFSVGFLTVEFPVLSMVNYWTIMLIPIPYLYSFRLIMGDEENRWYMIPWVITLIDLVVVNGLQWLNIADLKETLIMPQLTLLLVGAFCTIMCVKNICSYGFKGHVRMGTIGNVCCIAWLFMEFAVYHATSTLYTSAIGMIFLFVYVILLLHQSANESRNVLKYGMEARRLEKIAYYDQLTGMYNRMALAEYTNNEDFQTDNMSVAVFDINNLKKYNDTFGHDKGDWYIKECSRVIRESLGDIGLCYRTGGDEFMVLLKGVSETVIKNRMTELEEKVGLFNLQQQDVRMGIAWGYAFFDSAEDHDIEDTSKRADQMMYVCKYNMKNGTESKAIH